MKPPCHRQQLVNTGDTIDRQLATCECREKASSLGDSRRTSFRRFMRPTHTWLSKRLHLLGQQYGCVVVANAARQLAFCKDNIDIQTLCTVQGGHGR